MIHDSDIYREVIQRWEDNHPEAVIGPDEDSLRAYFANHLHADWPDRPDMRAIAGRACLTIGAILLVVGVALLVLG